MTSKPSTEIQNLIDTHIKGFNTQNLDLFLSVFGDTAIIIDGIAPYRWLNPDAPAHWLADVEKWRKSLSVVLTVKLPKQSVIRTGTLAYTFAKHKW